MKVEINGTEVYSDSKSIQHRVHINDEHGNEYVLFFSATPLGTFVFSAFSQSLNVQNYGGQFKIRAGDNKIVLQ